MNRRRTFFVGGESFRRWKRLRRAIGERIRLPQHVCSVTNGRRFPSPQPLVPSPRSSGFTLLEVILALAILAGSMAVLGQLVQMGMTNARKAEDMTQAVIAAESIMAEVVCGARSPTSDSGSIADESGSVVFEFIVDAAASDQQAGMLDVRVTVQSSVDAVEPVSCTLVRWVIDPDYAASLSETTTN